MMLRKMIEAGTFSYFLDEEIINWLDQKQWVFISKKSKQSLGLGSKLIKVQQALFMWAFWLWIP